MTHSRSTLSFAVASVCLAAALGLGFTSPASAQPPRRQPRVIELTDDFVIEGRVQKPNAFYILKRSQAEYDWARLDAKFLPLVLESVQDPLF
jgi:hypothetical protein